jgi:Replication-relaxation
MTSPPAPKRGTRIGPAGRAALDLLACCPRVPTDVLTVLLGHRQAVTTAQLLARLRRTGLAQYQAVILGPRLGPRPIRLWTLTAAGRVSVATRGTATGVDASKGLYGEPERWRDPARQRGIPLLVACYRLLAGVASGRDRPVRVCTWEHPWIRTVAPTEAGRRRRVRLPAAAVLQSRQIEGGHAERLLLLLPDVGTASLASYRPTLLALIDMRRTVLTNEEDEPVLIVGVASARHSSSGRIQAWWSLLQELARRFDEPPLRARVLALQTWLTSSRNQDDRRSTGQVDEVFALVARHPLMTRQQLASLLRTSTGRIARLEAELMERGWLRPVASDDLPLGARVPARDVVPRLGLVELTTAGRQEAARRLLVPAGLARRRHGVMSTDASMRRFLRHLHHTLGANAFFVDLAAAATRVSSRGGDEALLEWRSAAACAHGRFRPDGYGCYRRGPWRFGFFLEFDRGTERSRHYAGKLAMYYRHRDSGAYKRDYQSFPSLLFVTTSDAAEARFAQQARLAHEHHANAALSIFLTTSSLIEACPDGALGLIWRTAAAPWADRPARICWLPQPGCGINTARWTWPANSDSVDTETNRTHQHVRTPLKRLDNAHVL